MSIEIISGPSSEGMTKAAAEKALLAHPQFPKGAEYSVDELGGHWVAAVHVAAPPMPPEEDDTDDAGPPAPAKDDGPPSDGGDSDGPKPPHEDKGKGGDAHLLHALMDAVTQIGAALGVPIGDLGMGSPVPGMDDGMGGPPGGPGGPGGLDAGGPPPPPHPGAGGPPPHGGHPGAGGPPPPLPPHIKPTPGSPDAIPTFASVSEDHPWHATIGKVAHFRVNEPLGDTPLADAEKELQMIASAGGFKVSNFQPYVDKDGERAVTAVISTPKVNNG